MEMQAVADLAEETAKGIEALADLIRIPIDRFNSGEARPQDSLSAVHSSALALGDFAQRTADGTLDEPVATLLRRGNDDLDPWLAEVLAKIKEIKTYVGLVNGQADELYRLWHEGIKGGSNED